LANEDKGIDTMLTFFAAKGSCSLATHIALEEAGAAYDLRKIDTAGGEQRRPDYLKINPKGRVPALITVQGILTENVALLLYVAQTFPKANLAPADAFGLARMNAFNAWLASTVHVNHAHKMRGSRWSDDPAVIENLKLKVPQTMTDCATLIENEYLAGPWVMGEQFTVADGYLLTIENWFVSDGVDMALFPRITAHMAAMNARPAVQRVLQALG
jgi:glutathione S-transferase